MTQRRKVMITGYAVLSAHGGLAETWQGLVTRTSPVNRGFAAHSPEFPFARSYGISDFDPARYIRSRTDIRAMGPSMRYAAATAAQALEDAGLSAEAEVLARAGLYVGARFGERDADVDFGVCKQIAELEPHHERLNELLQRHLRPGAFLAQLPNLFAGNISLLFQIRGPSMTFVGEHGAGNFALSEAYAAISAGELDVALVGGCFNCDDYQTRFALAGSGVLSPDESAEDVSPVEAWSAQARGTVPGAAAAFLVLESQEHCTRRGGKAKAELATAVSDTSPRSMKSASASLTEQYERWLGAAGEAVSGFIGNGSGIPEIDREELRFLGQVCSSRQRALLTTSAPATGDVFHSSMALRVVLAAVALERGELFGLPPVRQRLPMPEGVELVEESRAAALTSICAVSIGAFESQGLAVVRHPPLI